MHTLIIEYHIAPHSIILYHIISYSVAQYIAHVLGCTWMPQMIDSITVVIGWISNVMCCVKYSMLSDSTLSKDLGEISPRIRRGSTNSNRFQGGSGCLAVRPKLSTAVESLRQKLHPSMTFHDNEVMDRFW